MKLLQNQAAFQLLTPETTLREMLLNIERAGRTSYQSETKPITEETASRFVRMLIRNGHYSVIEHSLMTVLFTCVSRGLTHELVRHRLAAFTQESTRYVDYSKGEVDLDRFQAGFIAPPSADVDALHTLPDGRQLSFADMLQIAEDFYRTLRQDGWLPEDARQILPTALESDIVVTANFREWRHIFQLRTAKDAHWEIRSAVGKLLLHVQTILPAVFGDFVQAGVDRQDIPYFTQVKI